MSAAPDIAGTFDPSFGAVADAFAQNFELRQEVGASLCIFKDGECVADLWGGQADATTGKAWDRDTVSIVFSCTKAATALCAHRLVDASKLNLHAKVTDYWPEYGVNGKEDTTVLMFLNHSAGVAAFDQPVPAGTFENWQAVTELLAQEKPWWTPGTRSGYHMITFGWTVGELVRRISGENLGAFFQRELAGPTGSDFWIGLPEEIEPRVAPMIHHIPGPNDALTPFTEKLLSDPASLQAKALLNTGGFDFNTREGHVAEIGGGGGISNARGMAKLFTSLSPSGDEPLFSEDRIAAMGSVSSATMQDATLLIGSRFGQGFMKSIDNRHMSGGHDASFIIGESAFGHVGMGGSCVFYDPGCDLVFAYSMNKMGSGILLNARGQSLVDATYESLGYRTNALGHWAL